MSTTDTGPWSPFKDLRLLSKDPIASKFFVWKTVLSTRHAQTNRTMVMPLIEDIRESPQALADADAWLVRVGRDVSPGKNASKLHEENLRIYVDFHWAMYLNRKDTAQVVLEKAWDKWGYGIKSEEKTSARPGKKARGSTGKASKNRVKPEVEEPETVTVPQDVPPPPTENASETLPKKKKNKRKKNEKGKSKACGASAEHCPSETMEDNGMFEVELVDDAQDGCPLSSSSTVVSENVSFMATPSSSHSTLVDSPSSVLTLVDAPSADFMDVENLERSKDPMSSKRKAAGIPSPPSTPRRHTLSAPQRCSKEHTAQGVVAPIYPLRYARWTSTDQQDQSDAEVSSPSRPSGKKKRQRVGDFEKDAAEVETHPEAHIVMEVDGPDVKDHDVEPENKSTPSEDTSPTFQVDYAAPAKSPSAQMQKKKKSQPATMFINKPKKASKPSVTGRTSVYPAAPLHGEQPTWTSTSSALTIFHAGTGQQASEPSPFWFAGHPMTPLAPKTSKVTFKSKKKADKAVKEPAAKRPRVDDADSELGRLSKHDDDMVFPESAVVNRAVDEIVALGHPQTVLSILQAEAALGTISALESSPLAVKRKRGEEHPVLATGSRGVNPSLPAEGMKERCILPKPRTLKKPPLSRFAPATSLFMEGDSLPVIDAQLQDIGAAAREYHFHREHMQCVDEFEVDVGGDDQAMVELPQEESRILLADCAEPFPMPPLPKEPLPEAVKPYIWAQSRQEVCESYDYFRSYQGGVYFNRDVAKGYLLSAFSSSRDKFHRAGRLIISHGGGKSEGVHMHNGRLEREGPTDQSSEDKSVRSLLNNYHERRPLVLLADDKYALFPYDLAAAGYTYVVLGFYWITHAWAEFQHVEENGSKVVRFKFAFQWCEEQGDPWWCRKPQNETPDNPDLSSQCEAPCPPTFVKNEETGEAFLPNSALPYERECDRCQRTSMQVYEIGWMCLTPKCPSFWVHEGKMPASNLAYSSRFLDTAPVCGGAPCTTDKLLPSPPPSGSLRGVVTTRQFARGMYCRKCGRLSSRTRWDCWECKGCHAIHHVTGTIRDHKQFWTQLSKLDFYDHLITRGSGILAEKPTFVNFKENGESKRLMMQTFTLPHNRGKIHVIPGTVLTNGRANDIFREYQEMASTGAIDFRRWPMRIHRCRGELLTNYFSQNTGAPYKYVGGAGRTVPLEDGPSAVRHALKLMKRRIRHALGRKVSFNEVLSAAYMERQKMAFHSDSERGLGPIVASLSLGSVALMHFRLHPQYADTTASRKTALTVALKHGDVLVMEGHDVQTYYEHTVVPMNFRIVATARMISPDNAFAK